MKLYLQLILYPNIKKKMWVTENSKELQPFEKGYVFGPFFCIMATLRARVILSLTRTHDVISSPLELKICECTEKSTRIQIHAKKRLVDCQYALRTRITRAWARTRGKF